jgi:protocatechuate 3,4-dioxygenase beta subunit
MARTFAAIALVLGLSLNGSSRPIVGGGCDGCEGIYDGMPRELSWETRIANDAEPGERLEMSGVIYRRDGKTPAPGVILYVYHTDAKGFYSPEGDAKGAARRHGHLRGWMKTGSQGEYRFTTIKPAPYPGQRIPAHVHPIVKEPDKNEYYIDEYLFDDDPLLTRAERARLENRGGSGIVHLTRGTNGVYRGRRDITLGLNIPNYR